MAGKNKNSGKKDKPGHAAENGTTVASNRRARFDYFIDDVIEAGIVLTGTEVKSLRSGQASINESYAGVRTTRYSCSTPISPNIPRRMPSCSTRCGARASCCCIATR